MQYIIVLSFLISKLRFNLTGEILTAIKMNNTAGSVKIRQGDVFFDTQKYRIIPSKENNKKKLTASAHNKPCLSLILSHNSANEQMGTTAKSTVFILGQMSPSLVIHLRKEILRKLYEPFNNCIMYKTPDNTKRTLFPKKRNIAYIMGIAYIRLITNQR